MNSEIPEYPAITQFSKSQRRVIGVLLEKGFTTPDSYPLTLKSVTTGCNQKSNRDPVSNYTEDAILSVLDELRKMGVVAVVHTETGRSERFRHYMRKRFTFSEQQLAILTELFLRGRQTLGELRARASRMTSIESLDILRTELKSLQEQGFLQASGSLERRGIEVDHLFYLEKEREKTLNSMQAVSSAPATSTTDDISNQPVSESPKPVVNNAPDNNEFQEEIRQLREENKQTKQDLLELKNSIELIQNDLQDLKNELGG